LTPQQRTQLEQLRQIKVSLFQCYSTETDFATFLMECLEKYGSGLPVDDMFKAKWFSDRIYALIQKIKASDDFLQDNSSDTDFTEPDPRYCQVFVW
jgi:hypothetical protein